MKQLLFCFFLLLGLTKLFVQQGVTSSGGNTKTKTTNLQVTAGAGVDRVLTSDATGVWML